MYIGPEHYYTLGSLTTHTYGVGDNRFLERKKKRKITLG